MGLDMYLNKMPRYKNATASDVSAIENYFEWKKAKEQGSKYANCSLEKWCGVKFSELPSTQYRFFYKKFFTLKYSHWDTEHKHGYYRIIDNVGYWRKANHIHNWFVANVQDNEDDCDYHNEVTKENLEELLQICNTVLNSCELVEAQVQNGETYKDGEWIPIMEDGYLVKDPTIAEELLPTQSGFFFGDTSYDKWYVEDIKETIQIIENVLKTTDFSKEMIYYISSW